MDPQYKDIFSMLYYSSVPLRYPARWIRGIMEEPWFLGEEAGVVRQAIDEAESEILLRRQQKLRSDAKYFLFLNLMEMIVVPIRMRGGMGFEKLRPMLRYDVRLLVGEASRREENRERFPEISGHAILDAVAANWRKLKLNDLRIWGEE